jgi:membrane-associated phospholipid phosphatase
MLNTRTQLTILLAILFAANFVETAFEPRLQGTKLLGPENSYRIANAISGLEGNLSFEFHDVTNRIAVYGFSLSYFLLFPLIALGTAWTLARRPEIQPYRVLCLAVAVDYLLSLPFYILFPLPERWAFPESGAMLLSDLWTSRLIEAVRPISALDNCFPSSHVSLTVVIVLTCWIYRVRFRGSLLALGLTVILATFVLGIHWIPDIIAGLAVGVLSVAVALHSLGARELLGSNV